MNTELPSLTRIRLTYLPFFFIWDALSTLIFMVLSGQAPENPVKGLLITGGVFTVITPLLLYFMRKDFNRPVWFFTVRWIIGALILLVEVAIASLALRYSGIDINTVDFYQLEQSTQILIVGIALVMLIPVTLLWNYGLYGLLHDFQDQWHLFDYLMIITINCLPIYMMFDLLQADVLLKPFKYIFLWQALIVFRRMRLYAGPQADHEVRTKGWLRWGLLAFLLPIGSGGFILFSRSIIGKLVELNRYCLSKVSLLNLQHHTMTIWEWLGFLGVLLLIGALISFGASWLQVRLNKADGLDKSVAKTTRLFLYGVAMLSSIIISYDIVKGNGCVDNLDAWGVWLAPSILFAILVQYLHYHSFWRFMVSILLMALMTVGYWLLGIILGFAFIVVIAIIVGLIILFVTTGSMLFSGMRGAPAGALSRIGYDMFIDEEGRIYEGKNDIVDEMLNTLNPFEKTVKVKPL